MRKTTLRQHDQDKITSGVFIPNPVKGKGQTTRDLLVTISHPTNFLLCYNYANIHHL